MSVDVLVIGSGAGGAVTALELARQGRGVTVLEAGPRPDLSTYGADPTVAMARLYRNRGMTPILGPVSIGFVEGRCIGGSTEINSGFWHRTPREALARWAAAWDLQEASPAQLDAAFDEVEQLVGLSTFGRERWPESTRRFAQGIESMGWSYAEVERSAVGCLNRNACANGCPSGAKQGMSRKVIPLAEAAGAQVIPDVSVLQLVRDGRRVTGVVALATRPDGRRELLRIDADHVFVCAGPTQTPALLRRSGLKYHVGDTLNIHPMLKVAAIFPDPVHATQSVLPLLQVKQFWPDISMGGAFLTAGHAAMHLSDNWSEQYGHMADLDRMASYYVAVRGTGHGTVRGAQIGEGVTLTYRLTLAERTALSQGFARLCMLLLAAGAEVVLPGVQRMAPIRTERDAARWLDDVLPAGSLSLTTVHAFSSCPAGERMDRCAVDSAGRVHGMDNLYVSDASLLPDSPGVNPQGSVMAFALRNARRFGATR